MIILFNIPITVSEKKYIKNLRKILMMGGDEGNRY